MKLVKKVDLILFPIICGIFMICGILVYSSTEQRIYTHYEAMVQNALESGFKEAEFEFSSIQKTLGLIQNSAEFVRFMNEKDTHYQAFSLNASLYALIERTLKDTNIHSFYVTDSQRNVILDYERDGDPFADSSLNHISPKYVDRYFDSFENTSDLIGFGSIQLSAERGYEAIYGRSASVRLLDHDTLATSKNGYIGLFLTSKLEVIDQLTASIERIFQPGYTYSFDEFLDKEKLTSPVYQVETIGDDIVGKLSFSYYKFTLTIPKRSIQVYLNSQLWSVFITSFSAAIISFLLLRMLIIKQIVNPIKSLTESIQKTSKVTSARLKPMNNGGEIGALNNAYIDLLNKLQDLASYDNLTGLSNRRNFESLLSEIVKDAEGKNEHAALLFIDLDNFKNVNDTYGHSTGDSLLKEFATRLQDAIRDTDIATQLTNSEAARLAGDEFAVILRNIPNIGAAEQVADRILSMFDNQFVLNGVHHDIKASIGIATTENSQYNADLLLRDADIAMYQAKSLGRNRLQVHDESLGIQQQTVALIEAELNRSLTENTFNLVSMPIYQLSSKAIVGYEVLIRCPNLQKHGIGPDQFISVAEETNLIYRIDEWVIRNAMMQYKEAMSRGFQGFICVNVSALELKNSDFIPMLTGVADHYGIEPRLIHLEVTETRLVKPDEKTTQCLKALHDLGFKIALDDFGTGYTAFSQLTHYPVDIIKIDRTFVSNHDNSKHQILIQTIMAIAKVYNIEVIAEGIENEQQLEFLLESDCVLGQGFGLCKPLSNSEFIQMISCSL